jgi:hypothetical protein
MGVRSRPDGTKEIMDRDEASLRFVAHLLAGREEGDVLVPADAAWRFREQDLPPGSGTAIWGRRTASAPDGSTTPSLVRALRREVALASIGRRLPAGCRAVQTLRLPPPSARPVSARARVRHALLAGAIVRIRRGAPIATVLDEIATAAGVEVPPGSVVPGAGIGAWMRATQADGTRVLVRLGPVGSPTDPRRSAEALQALADRPEVPRSLRTGIVGQVAWSVEALLPGAMPRSLDRGITDAVARFTDRLPPADGPPAAPREDLAAIGAVLPDRRGRLEAMADHVDRTLADVPGVLRHGDLWAGNLLVDAGALTGVIDWDAWHPSGAPGADLLHLLVADRAARSRRHRGRVWAEAPWRDRRFEASQPVTLGPAPREDVLRAVAVAGWAAQVASNLRHAPELAGRGRWVEGTIDPML